MLGCTTGLLIALANVPAGGYVSFGLMEYLGLPLKFLVNFLVRDLTYYEQFLISFLALPLGNFVLWFTATYLFWTRKYRRWLALALGLYIIPGTLLEIFSWIRN
ncbi:MAG: hypothetical protein JXQ71_04885 [Verrucomicrobia bacterium]|nr:hypothetical protein [Verrucomicrobiota bacterium]